MPEHIQYEDDDLFNPETHHEESDVPVKPLWWALILFVVFGAITHFVLWFFYQGMRKAEMRRWDPPQTTVTRPEDADIPKNQPLLQPFPHVEEGAITETVAVPYQNTPVTDMQAMRAAEEKVLQHYGWVDKQRGVVHIPIDEAKNLFAAQVAVQSQGAAATTTAAGQAPVATPVGSVPSPAGTPVPPDTGAAPSATTATTTGGAH